MGDISLNAGIRSSLLQLQKSGSLFDQTTSRLSSGKRVNSAVDNPTNFFAAVNLNDRAEGLSARLDDMGQAVQRIQAADQGITTIRSFLSAMKGVVNNALGNADSSARQDLGEQFNELVNQIGSTATDSTYQGVNLLQASDDSAGETQTVQFNETFDESTLSVDGFNIETGAYADGLFTATSEVDVTDAGVTTLSFAGYTETNDGGAAILVSGQDDTVTAIAIQAYAAAADGGMSAVTDAVSGSVDWGGDEYKDMLGSVIQQIEAFDAELKTKASGLANNLATITTREEFTTGMVNTLSAGADKLTLADLNEEGANLLALQTSNQLATQSLSLASQQSQSVLQLIG